MTVSGSTDFKSTASELIVDARRLLGINAEEEPLSASDLVIGLRFLTKMLKTWQADPDLGTWLTTSLSLTLVQGTSSYLFGVGGALTTIPFDVLRDPPAMITRSASSVIEMTAISRGDYQRLPNKTTQGCPSQWFYDRQRDSGTWYCWPAPDATAGTVDIPIRRRIMDLDAGADNLDLPPEWEEPVTNNLAKRLIPVYGRGGSPEAAQVMLDAKDMLDALKRFDATNDNGSVMMGPESRYDNRWR